MPETETRSAWAAEWEEPAFIREPLISRWARQQRALMEDGEIPADGELVPPPRIRPGVWLRSMSMRRDDPHCPLGRGGIVWRRSALDDGWDTLEAWRGTVEAFRVADDDIDWVQYLGVVDTIAVRNLLRSIGTAVGGTRAKQKRAMGFWSAAAVLEAILENPALQSNADADVDPRVTR